MGAERFGEDFGETAAGEPVREVRLSGHGLTVSLLTLGALLRDLRLEGVAHPLVLGLNTVADYETKSPFFGATAGRCANRIGYGRFTLDGVAHRLETNDGPHHLHGGGAASFGRRVWTLESAEPERAAFGLISPDGEGGYPGRLEARCVYRLLAGPTLSVEYAAVAKAPTLCNLAHHSYFNLDGRADVSAHRLQVAAEAVTPIGDDLIPTGEVALVAGTRLDLREARPVVDGELRDHNYALAAQRAEAPRFAARLEAGGLSMEVWTTEPGLQVYDGFKIPAMEGGLEGRRYASRAGLCLEPQLWPDAINHRHFPSPVLRPGEIYRQTTAFRFARA